jgi:4-carboxymuconolactone decarboxylase
MTDRFPPIPAQALTPRQDEARREFHATRGVDVFGPFVPLLRSPEVMTRVSALGDHLRHRSALPARVREIVILLVARAWSQQYEWHVHEPIARAAGVDAATIAAIAEGRTPDTPGEDDAIACALVEELQRTRQVRDETFARARQRWGDQGVIDAVAIAGYYTLLAMILNTAGTPLPPGAATPLAP